MRRFVTACVDELTGFYMELSEVSYNMAMDWLQREAKKFDKEIYRVESEGEDVKIYVGTPVMDINPITGHQDKWFRNTLIFHYDESRGYLMQE